MRDELSSLWQKLLADAAEPDFVWQVLAVLACLALAKLVERYVVGRPATADASRAWQLGRGSLRRVAFPLVAAGLLLAVRAAMRSHLHTHLLAVALPLLLSLAGIRMVFYVLRHSFAHAAWLRYFERSFAFMVWGVAAMYIVGVLPDVIEVFDSVGFSAGKQHITLWTLIEGTAAVAVTLLVALWVSGLIESKLAVAEGLDVNLREVFARIVRAVLVLIAVLVSLPLVGFDLTTLSVFGGALGVGLGFGLQKIASNYVSGFIILLERSIRIGSVVTVESQRGEVTRITTRYTVLRGQAGIEALVPNELLVTAVVLNESYSDRVVRVALPVQVGYDSDLDRAMALMTEAARAQPRVLADPEPLVLVKGFGESGIDLELGCWIQDPEGGTAQLRSDINLAIWHAFKNNGITIPYPQREVRLLGVQHES